MSIVALNNIYRGGLDKLHRKKNSGRESIRLRSNKGGPYTAILAVGDKCKQTLLDMNLLWHSFLKNNWPHNKDYKPKDMPEELLLNVVAELFAFPKESYNLHATRAVLDKLCILGRQNPYELIKALVKNMKLYEAVEKVSWYIFTAWRKHLEDMISKYAKQTVGLKKFNEILTEWRAIDRAHNINSSSIILLALSPHKRPSDMPWLKKKGPDKWNTEISKIPTSGPLQKALNDWHYNGYCSCKPIKRLLDLLSFPIDELQVELQRLGISISTMPINKFKKLTKIELPKKPSQSIMPITTECKMSELDNPAEDLRNAVEHFLLIINSLKEYLVEYEHYYVTIAKALAKINNMIVDNFG